MMSRVKNKHTAPEMAVRSLVHRMGFRFRLHNSSLPGNPDIVMSRHKKIILVHGCFWHQHRGCRSAKRPTSNQQFWNKKLDDNIRRDRLNSRRLSDLGWKVLVVWECNVSDRTKLARILEDFLSE